jgi:adenine phosphoribosyltransferase
MIEMLERLKDSLDKCPVVEMGGYHYFVHPVTDGVPYMDPKLNEEVINEMIRIGNFDCDYIVAPEAMGIPLAVPIAMKLDIPYTIVRKRKYGLPGETNIAQYTGYSKSDMYINGLKKGDRVVIVDDVLSTGGTMRAIINALKNIIGCEIVDVIVVFEKTDKKPEMEKEFGVKIKTLMRVKVEGKKVIYNE